VLQTQRSREAPARRVTPGSGPLRLRPGDRVSYHLGQRQRRGGRRAAGGLPDAGDQGLSAAEHTRESLIRARASGSDWWRCSATGWRRSRRPRTPIRRRSGMRRRSAGPGRARPVAGALRRRERAPQGQARARRRWVARSDTPPRAWVRRCIERASPARRSRAAPGARDGTVRQFNGALQAEIREEEKDVLYLETCSIAPASTPCRRWARSWPRRGASWRGSPKSCARPRTRTPSASCWRKWIACASASRISCRACRSSPRGIQTST